MQKFENQHFAEGDKIWFLFCVMSNDNLVKGDIKITRKLQFWTKKISFLRNVWQLTFHKFLAQLSQLAF